ncbi:MAG: S8 family serine peptidase [Chloroflexi bacterium]|nr:S8 family serine peptidase [Chloroflexota bacterium]MDA1003448.1 S8 family serine peptidase [Chloroflexota bacterium]
MVLHKLLSWRLPAATIAIVAVLAAALIFGRAPTPSTAHVAQMATPANVHGAVFDTAFHQDGFVSVIIQSAGNPVAAAEAVRAAGGVVTQQYSIIPALEADVPVDAIQALAGNPLVRRISLNAPIEQTDLGDDLAAVASDLEAVPDAQLASVATLTETVDVTADALVEAEADAATASAKDLKVLKRSAAKAEKAALKAEAALAKAATRLARAEKKQAEREATAAARDAEKAQKRLLKGDRRSLYGAKTPRNSDRNDYRDLSSLFPSVVGATDVWDDGVKGTGIGIAIVDSGIKNGAVTDFSSRILVAYSVVGDGEQDEAGHGTHVAGVAAGNGANSDERFMGIAPEANIIGVQVGRFSEGVRLGDALLGLEYVLNHRVQYNIRVANLSFTQSVPESYLVSPLDAAVEQLWFNGIVVVAQGNRGSNAFAADHPPANDPFVISVGAYSDNETVETTDDYLKDWSSRGVTMEGFSKPNVVAPGHNLIATAGNGLSTLYQNYPEKQVGDRYVKMSGTSAAAPVVSGISALILQQNPSLTPDQVKARIVNNATPFAGSNAPSVNAYQAVFGPDQGFDNAGIPRSFLLDPRPLYAILAAGYLQSQVEAGAITWDAITWDAITWDAITWDAITWDAITWDAITWDAITWDAITWDAITWDAITWDAITWDAITWDAITWDAITWDAITWDAITWDAITWDAITWDAITWDAITWDAVLED